MSRIDSQFLTHYTCVVSQTDQFVAPLNRPPLLQRALRPILVCFLSISFISLCLGLYTQFWAAKQPAGTRTAPVSLYSPVAGHPAPIVYVPPIVAKAYRPVERAWLTAFFILLVTGAIVARRHRKRQ